jgi:hypothetical protein
MSKTDHPEGFGIRARPSREQRTLAEFVERSKKYRGSMEGLEIGRNWRMQARDKRPELFDGSFIDPDKT